jgi:hypothetical protein
MGLKRQMAAGRCKLLTAEGSGVHFFPGIERCGKYSNIDASNYFLFATMIWDMDPKKETFYVRKSDRTWPV